MAVGDHTVHGMVLYVRDLMHRSVRTVRAETTIETAAAVFWETGYGALPVVDDQHHLIGIVSAADLLPDLQEAPTHHRPQTVAAVMTTEPELTHTSPNSDVRVVAARMRYYGVRVMPIVDYGCHGYLVGILTRGDLLRRSPPKPPPRPPRHAPTGPLASDVMTPRHLIEWVHESDPAEMAAERLNHRAYTALPVLDREGRFVGLVSEADLVWPSRLDWTGVRRKPDQRIVGDVMTANVDTRAPDTHVTELARLLGPGKYRMVPIIDVHRQLVGVVSRTDLLHPETLRILKTVGDVPAPGSAQPVSVQAVEPPLPAPAEVPPGWYVDPDGKPGYRWWDGTTWTRASTADGEPYGSV